MSNIISLDAALHERHWKTRSWVLAARKENEALAKLREEFINGPNEDDYAQDFMPPEEWQEMRIVSLCAHVAHFSERCMELARSGEMIAEYEAECAAKKGAPK